jgi:hypothetical protein
MDLYNINYSIASKDFNYDSVFNFLNKDNKDYDVRVLHDDFSIQSIKSNSNMTIHSDGISNIIADRIDTIDVMQGLAFAEGSIFDDDFSDDDDDDEDNSQQQHHNHDYYDNNGKSRYYMKENTMKVINVLSLFSSINNQKNSSSNGNQQYSRTTR